MLCVRVLFCNERCPLLQWVFLGAPACLVVEGLTHHSAWPFSSRCRLPDQAKQQDRDLLANNLGTTGPAGKELCPMLCVRQRSHWGQDDARARARILSMTGLKHVPCVSKKLFLLGLLGLSVEQAIFLLSRGIWPYEMQSANLLNGVLCLHANLCPILASWVFTV